MTVAETYLGLCQTFITEHFEEIVNILKKKLTAKSRLPFS